MYIYVNVGKLGIIYISIGLPKVTRLGLVQLRYLVLRLY
jgi:hypothetical protein